MLVRKALVYGTTKTVRSRLPKIHSIIIVPIGYKLFRIADHHLKTTVKPQHREKQVEGHTVADPNNRIKRYLQTYNTFKPLDA